MADAAGGPGGHGGSKSTLTGLLNSVKTSIKQLQQSQARDGRRDAKGGGAAARQQAAQAQAASALEYRTMPREQLIQLALFALEERDYAASRLHEQLARGDPGRLRVELERAHEQRDAAVAAVAALRESVHARLGAGRRRGSVADAASAFGDASGDASGAPGRLAAPHGGAAAAAAATAPTLPPPTARATMLAAAPRSVSMLADDSGGPGATAVPAAIPALTRLALPSAASSEPSLEAPAGCGKGSGAVHTAAIAASAAAAAALAAAAAAPSDEALHSARSAGSFGSVGGDSGDGGAHHDASVVGEASSAPHVAASAASALPKTSAGGALLDSSSLERLPSFAVPLPVTAAAATTTAATATLHPTLCASSAVGSAPAAAVYDDAFGDFDLAGPPGPPAAAPLSSAAAPGGGAAALLEFAGTLDDDGAASVPADEPATEPDASACVPGSGAPPPHSRPGPTVASSSLLGVSGSPSPCSHAAAAHTVGGGILFLSPGARSRRGSLASSVVALPGSSPGSGGLSIASFGGGGAHVAHGGSGITSAALPPTGGTRLAASPPAAVDDSVVSPARGGGLPIQSLSSFAGAVRPAPSVATTSNSSEAPPGDAGVVAAFDSQLQQAQAAHVSRLSAELRYASSELESARAALLLAEVDSGAARLNYQLSLSQLQATLSREADELRGELDRLREAHAQLGVDAAQLRAKVGEGSQKAAAMRAEVASLRAENALLKLAQMRHHAAAAAAASAALAATPATAQAAANAGAAGGVLSLTLDQWQQQRLQLAQLKRMRLQQLQPPPPVQVRPSRSRAGTADSASSAPSLAGHAPPGGVSSHSPPPALRPASSRAPMSGRDGPSPASPAAAAVPVSSLEAFLGGATEGGGGERGESPHPHGGESAAAPTGQSSVAGGPASPGHAASSGVSHQGATTTASTTTTTTGKWTSSFAGFFGAGGSGSIATTAATTAAAAAAPAVLIGRSRGASSVNASGAPDAPGAGVGGGLARPAITGSGGGGSGWGSLPRWSGGHSSSSTHLAGLDGGVGAPGVDTVPPAAVAPALAGPAAATSGSRPRDRGSSLEDTLRLGLGSIGFGGLVGGARSRPAPPPPGSVVAGVIVDTGAAEPSQHAQTASALPALGRSLAAESRSSSLSSLASSSQHTTTTAAAATPMATPSAAAALALVARARGASSVFDDISRDRRGSSGGVDTCSLDAFDDASAPAGAAPSCAAPVPAPPMAWPSAMPPASPPPVSARRLASGARHQPAAWSQHHRDSQRRRRARSMPCGLPCESGIAPSHDGSGLDEDTRPTSLVVSHALASVPLFASLDASERRLIAAAFSHQRVRHGCTDAVGALARGAPAPALYVVVEGAAIVLDRAQRSGGRSWLPPPLGRFGAGACFSSDAFPLGALVVPPSHGTDSAALSLLMLPLPSLAALLAWFAGAQALRREHAAVVAARLHAQLAGACGGGGPPGLRRHLQARTGDAVAAAAVTSRIQAGISHAGDIDAYLAVLRRHAGHLRALPLEQARPFSHAQHGLQRALSVAAAAVDDDGGGGGGASGEAAAAGAAEPHASVVGHPAVAAAMRSLEAAIKRDVEQSLRDFGREPSVVLNGVVHALGSHPDSLPGFVRSLAGAVAAGLASDAECMRRLGALAGGDPVPLVAQQPRQQRRRLDSMRQLLTRAVSAVVADVLVAASRTVTGGDTFTACHGLLGHSDLAFLAAETSTQAPVEIVVDGATVAVESVNAYRVVGSGSGGDGFVSALGSPVFLGGGGSGSGSSSSSSSGGSDRGVHHAAASQQQQQPHHPLARRGLAAASGGGGGLQVWALLRCVTRESIAYEVAAAGASGPISEFEGATRRVAALLGDGNDDGVAAAAVLELPPIAEGDEPPLGSAATSSSSGGGGGGALSPPPAGASPTGHPPALGSCFAIEDDEDAAEGGGVGRRGAGGGAVSGGAGAPLAASSRRRLAALSVASDACTSSSSGSSSSVAASPAVAASSDHAGFVGGGAAEARPAACVPPNATPSEAAAAAGGAAAAESEAAAAAAAAAAAPSSLPLLLEADELPAEPAALPAALASAAAQCELSRELHQLQLGGGSQAGGGAPCGSDNDGGAAAAPPLVSHVVRSLDIAVTVLDEPV